MKYLLALLSTTGVLLGQGTQSAVLNGTSQAFTVTLPSSAPYTSVTNMCLEWRMPVWPSNPASNATIFAGGGMVAVIIASTNSLRVTDFNESGSPSSVIDLTGRTDVIARYCKIAGGDIVVQILDADGTNFAQSCTAGLVDLSCAPASSSGKDMSGQICIGYNCANNWFAGRIAYFRWYTTVTPTSLLYGKFLPTNVSTGDLIDYEFEGNGNDTSSRAQHYSNVGTPTYTTTPYFAYLPHDFSSKSGQSFTVSGASSGASTYTFTQTAGTTCGLTNASTSVVTVGTGCTGLSQVTVHLSATSAASQTDTADVNVGLVPTDSRGVVQDADAIWDFLDGPMVMADETAPSYSPLPFFETNRTYLSDYWYRNSTTAPGGAWPTTWNGIEEHQSYYSTLAQLYRQYRRSGLTIYQTQARAFGLFLYALSDGWNNGSPTGGCGSNWVAGRDSVADGFIMLAYDGQISMTCVRQYVDYYFNLYLETKDIDHAVGGAVGFAPWVSIRESGYAYYFGVLLSVADTDSTEKAAWVTRIAAEFNKYWLPYQCGNGTYTPIGCGVITSSITGTISTTSGTKNIVGSGTNFNTSLNVGIARAVVMKGGSGYSSSFAVTSTGCSGYTMTATATGGVVTGVTVSVKGTCTDTEFIGPLDFSAGGGTGATGYREAYHFWLNDVIGCPTAVVIYTTWTYPVVATITDGTHATVTANIGTSNTGCTAFTDTIGAANDTGAIREIDNGGGYGGIAEEPWLATLATEGIARYYLRTSDANALSWLQRQGTHIAVNVYDSGACPFSTTGRAVWYLIYGTTSPAFTSCADSDTVHAKRAQNNTVPHLFGWLYSFTGLTAWKTYGDEYFSSTFGDGIGSGADIYFGQFASRYDSKFYGQSLRSADAYLALRLTTAASSAVGGHLLAGGFLQ